MIKNHTKLTAFIIALIFSFSVFTPVAIMAEDDSEQTITIIPKSMSKFMYEDDPVFEYEVEGLQSGQTVDSIGLTGELGRVAGESPDYYDYTLGTLKANDGITLVLFEELEYSDKYQKEIPIFHFTIIDPREGKIIVQIIPDEMQKTEGESDPIFFFTAVGLEPSDYLSEDGDFYVELARDLDITEDNPDGENPGAYDLYISYMHDKQNKYFFELDTNVKFSIIPKLRTELFIVPDTLSKLQGEPDPVFTYEIFGLPFDTDISDVGIYGELSRVDAGNDEIGRYEYTLGSLTAPDDYVLTLDTHDSPSFNVYGISDTQKIIYVIPVKAEKTKGSADPVFEYYIENVGDLDEGVIITGNIARTQGEEVGAYAFNTGTLTANRNYIFQITPGFSDALFFEITDPALSDHTLYYQGLSFPNIHLANPTGEMSLADFNSYISQWSDTIEEVGSFSLSPGSLKMTNANRFKFNIVFTPDNPETYKTAFKEFNVRIASTGRVTGNEDISINDALAIFKYMASILSANDISLAAADINKDQQIGVPDALAIFKFLASLPLGDDADGNPIELISFIKGYSD